MTRRVTSASQTTRAKGRKMLDLLGPGEVNIMLTPKQKKKGRRIRMAEPKEQARAVPVDQRKILEEAEKFYRAFAANDFEPFVVLRPHMEERRQRDPTRPTVAREL